jgi:hypothetical protein
MSLHASGTSFRVVRYGLTIPSAFNASREDEDLLRELRLSSWATMTINTQSASVYTGSVFI